MKLYIDIPVSSVYTHRAYSPPYAFPKRHLVLASHAIRSSPILVARQFLLSCQYPGVPIQLLHHALDAKLLGIEFHLLSILCHNISTRFIANAPLVSDPFRTGVVDACRHTEFDLNKALLPRRPGQNLGVDLHGCARISGQE